MAINILLPDSPTDLQLTQNSNEIDCVVREAEWRHSHTETGDFIHIVCCVGPHCASNNGKFNTYCHANLHTI